VSEIGGVWKKVSDVLGRVEEGLGGDPIGRWFMGAIDFMLYNRIAY
jgi:hypothetical protein